VSIALFITLAGGLGVMWIEARRWAWGGEQLAIFALAIVWLIAYVSGRTRVVWRWTLCRPRWQSLLEPRNCFCTPPSIPGKPANTF
jgi:hypothetical protein